MDVYIFLCFLFAVSALVERMLPMNARKRLFFVNGLVLLVIVGGRSCGTDYWLYKDVIEKGIMEEVLWPPLFILWAKVFSFQILIFLVAIFTIVPFYYIIYKISNGLYNLAAAFFFTEYFFMTLMQQSRQGVALAAIAWCVVFGDMKRVKLCLMCFYAAMVHLVGLFGFLTLLVRRKFYTLRTYISIYGVSLLFGGVIFDYLMRNVSNIGLLWISLKFSGYADRTERLDAEIPLFSFRFLLFFTILFYCYKNRKRLKNVHLSYMCNILFFGICFYTLFNPIVDLAVRGSNCFILLYFFIVLIILGEKYIPKFQRNIIYVFSICYCLYLMIRYMNMIVEQNVYLDLVPYSFFMEHIL